MSILKFVKSGIKRLVSTLKYRWDVYKKLKSIKHSIAVSRDNIPKLSSEQRKAIREYWEKYGIDMSYEWHKFLYAKTGKEMPEFVSKLAFNHNVRPYMNDRRLAGAWSDKAYLDYFLHDVRTPKCVIRNVSGRFLDGEFQIISAEESLRIMNRYDELVIKPTLYTHTGIGVRLLHKPYDLEDIKKQYIKDYVIQLPLHQHKDMSALNASSVNTIRVNSVLLETEAYVMSAFVKVGEAGQFADNGGSNRFFIGIDVETGAMNDYAIDHSMNKYTAIPSGYLFAGKQIPAFALVCEAVCKAHKCIPHFGFAFWDVCVCDDGEPAIVEVNLRNPDSTIAQATGEPFLGKYTEEILRFISDNKTGSAQEK